ncbi:MAG: hypothetical protein HC922_10655 [Leptolyngbyaceae cyanobacterium SM2_3_12]|nr:hypothetical protein [Leptolyngbyaceae cyanobacterium SM2_3_12]
MISALTTTVLFMTLAGIHRYFVQQLMITDLTPGQAPPPPPPLPLRCGPRPIPRDDPSEARGDQATFR